MLGSIPSLLYGRVLFTVDGQLNNYLGLKFAKSWRQFNILIKLLRSIKLLMRISKGNVVHMFQWSYLWSIYLTVTLTAQFNQSSSGTISLNLLLPKAV